jgi:DNA-binding transcriptional LysR family regulator
VTGRVERVEIFLEVARRGSFSAAARALRLSPPAVTRLIAELEADLGVQLLVRTTRKVVLTSAGEAYFEKAGAAAAQLRAAGEFVRQQHNMLTGTLKVTAPLSFGLRYLADAFSRFRVLYDRIDLVLDLDDRFVDIVSEGYDMALRISGPPSDLSTIWRKIMPVRRVIVAAPSYLARLGTPHHPDDLREHDMLGYSNLTEGPGWTLQREGQKRVVPNTRFCLLCNNGDILADLAALGEGLALLPLFIVEERITNGALIEVLGDWQPPETWLTAYYPPYQKLPAKVETFTRFIEDVVAA